VDPASLSAAIKKQVEFYFSRENLKHDSFLVAQMDANHYVPISVILEFSKIKALTSSAAQIVDAMKDSTVCSLDSTRAMIKPNTVGVRSTIILRELGATNEEAVRKIFTAEGCGAPVSVHQVLDQWFVTMEDEATATSTALALRKVTFNGEPVKVRVKSESLVRPSGAGLSMSMGAPPFVPSPLMPPVDMTLFPGVQFMGGPLFFGAEPYGSAALAPAAAAAAAVAAAGGGVKVQPAPKAHKGAKPAAAPKAPSTPPKKAPKPAAAAAEPPAVPLTSDDHFPRLLAADSLSSKPVKVYTKQAVEEVVQAMAKQDIPRPDSMNPVDDVAAVRDTANVDLIRKLRSGSMDLAVRHGRPRIESIDSVSSYDYSSLMLGEGVVGAHKHPRRKVSRSDPSKVDKDSSGSPAAPAGGAGSDAAKASKGAYAAALLAGGSGSSPVPASVRPPRPVQKAASSASSKDSPSPPSSGNAAGAAPAKGKGKQAVPPPPVPSQPSVDPAAPAAAASAPSPSKAKRGWEKPDVPPVVPVPKPVKVDTADGAAGAETASSPAATPAAATPEAAAAPAPAVAAPAPAPPAATAEVPQPVAAPAPEVAAAPAPAVPPPTVKPTLSFAAALKKTLPADAPVFVSKHAAVAAPAPAAAPTAAPPSGDVPAPAAAAAADPKKTKQRRERRKPEGEQGKRRPVPAPAPAPSPDDFAEVTHTKARKRNGAA